MKNFEYINVESVTDASQALREGNAVALAGGTDLLGVLKDEILPQYPERVVNLKKIPGMNEIKKMDDGVRIGANVTLTEIAESAVIKENWQALADAAYSVASPNIRNAATIAGNICQDVRCWYYRYPHIVGGRVDCARKDGSLCSAVMGENRYHSIFGGIPVNTPPCSTACPAGTDIGAYMEEMRAGNMDAAANIILRVNPMPALTSRVCPHFCQSDCNRNNYDESVNISSIERQLGDYILENYQKFMKAPEKENGKSVAIIGSGPVGLVTAYYLRQSGYAVTVYEMHEKAGGCLMYAIPPYRLPKDIVQKYIDILTEMGIQFVYNTKVGEAITLDEMKAKFDQVLIGIGTWSRPYINIEGEDLAEFGLDFLIRSNAGDDTKPGDNVIVVGGGDVAIDVAMNAKRLGAKTVTMYCLESREEMPASKEEVKIALEEGIQIENGWGPTKVTDDTIAFKRCLKVKDAAGRFNPIYDEVDMITVSQDKVFMSVGQRGDVQGLLRDNTSVEMVNGRISTTNCDTTDEKILVGGDIAYGPQTVIKAVAHGKRVAKEMNRRIGEGQLEVEKVDATFSRQNALKFKENVAEFYKQQPKPMKTPDDRSMYTEDAPGYTPAQTDMELSRCFNCGCVAVNPSDMANMLFALDAKIITNYTTYTAEEFFTKHADLKKVLAQGEIVTEIFVPYTADDAIATYNKYRLRKSIDFAVLALATNYVIQDGVVKKANIILGAVAPTPKKATAAEDYLVGKKLTDEVIEEVAELALKDAIKLKYNEYKIEMAKEYIRRSLTALN